ncbi:RNA polymerase sigma factor [Chitinophaga sp. CF418]|uniref:RNA polymerase sigma factor n=1 Tax=Chitinophaga sp. CF418 TaxID=1855287 RepID=UPI0009105E54|nr:RNA polymerase sigma-70 factor [Chitinophaga sp. CF418]SHM83902.1 RNA polymerase sigma-70 factor, ECF subfamily [Chitinophaga sp. CF418]
MKGRYQLYNDAQLAELLFQQDTRAFEEVYNRYFGIIYSFTHKMLRDGEQAEDIVQEIFMNLYEKMGSIVINSLQSYLYQSARYALIDYTRQRKTRIDCMAGLKRYYEQGKWETDDTVIENELRRQIEKEINNLPPKMRAIFEMSRKQYLNNKEIAKRSGLSEGTVRLQIHNAITKLRSKLSCFLLLQFMATILWLNRTF